jgi:hypothetical protein
MTIFKGEAPMHKDWSIILMLNVLDGTNFNWLQKNPITQFTNARMKLTEKEVIEAINLTGYDRQQIKQLHAFKAELNTKKPKCTNCKRTRHGFKGLWVKGGSTADKAPEWWKKLQEKDLSKDSPKAKSKSKESAHTSKDSDSGDSHTEAVGVAIFEEDVLG